MAMMMDVEWEACCIEPVRDRELERHIRREAGYVPGSIRYYAQCPWLARSRARSNFLTANLVHVPLELAEKIALVVAQDNSCRYCFYGVRTLMRLMGLPEQHIRRLEQDLLTADVDPRERAVLLFARRLSRSNPLLTPRDLEPLQAAGFSAEAIREVALLAANSCVSNRLSTFVAMPPGANERIGNGLLGRLLLPIVGPSLRGKWGAGKPDFFASEVGDAPFAPLIVAMDGLPLGRALWEIVEGAWASDILPRRSKALVFAVVARALGCEPSEREAARLVAAEGMTGADLEPVLEHLGSPQLDAVEAQIVPFARETVWYQPAPIQRRVQALREHLTVPQLLELIGIAAVANMVCRLCVLASER